jgi:SAM-dependent methyltransferase
MTTEVRAARVDADALRGQISNKYTEVALTPEKGFHFHTGRPLAQMLGYNDDIVDVLPQGTVDSFAGTGNPFSFGDLRPGETVLDIGCGAGFDTLIAARQVGPTGRVIAVDMTSAMLEKTAAGAEALGLDNVDCRQGLAEDLPLDSESVDVVISNGVINLCPDKMAVMKEVHRVLKPGGRLQIADIVVHREVSQASKDDIDLWSG